ncbi:MAG TPA: alpha/beta hydrolase [Propionibacteriaceae bacterium]|nr:alpha/beta hydrolase [Propionibacteriaceae bacterium]
MTSPSEGAATDTPAGDAAPVEAPPPPHVLWRDWREDELIPTYEARDMELVGVRRHPEEIDPEVGDDTLVATLVRRNPPHHDRAVLYLHGWNDYFFQTHVATWWDELGYDFYALDLRRYGRSLRAGMMPGFIEDLREYDLEIDAAVDEVSSSHDGLVLYAHSTGGLIGSLWADGHPHTLAGLVLNSPWIDLQGSALVRALVPPIVRGLATRASTFVLPLPDNGFYARTLDALSDGTWTYDPELKRSPSNPTRSGWLTAVMAGHDRVSAGLAIDCPILMVTSTRSDFRRRWSDDLLGVDSVLDVSRLAAKAHCLGPHLTLVRLEGAVHDVVLSPRTVRDRFHDEIRRWEGAYLR